MLKPIDKQEIVCYYIVTGQGKPERKKEVFEMKKYYKAFATVTNNERVWDICIYSMYETIKEANEGINRFSKQMSGCVDVIKAWVE